MLSSLLQESPLLPPVSQCGGRGPAPRPGSLRLCPRPLVLLPQGSPSDVSLRGPPGGHWSPGDGRPRAPGEAAITDITDGGPGTEHQPVQPGALHQPQPPVPWPALGPSQGQDVSIMMMMFTLPWCINTMWNLLKWLNFLFKRSGRLIWMNFNLNNVALMFDQKYENTLKWDITEIIDGSNFLPESRKHPVVLPLWVLGNVSIWTKYKFVSINFHKNFWVTFLWLGQIWGSFATLPSLKKDFKTSKINLYWSFSLFELWSNLFSVLKAQKHICIESFIMHPRASEMSNVLAALYLSRLQL